MKVIVVKSFSDGDVNKCITPKLEVEVENKFYEIINFRNYYFCVFDNIQAGREGQIPVNENSYKNIYATIIYCLAPYLDWTHAYEVEDSNRLVKEFVNATKKYYGEAWIWIHLN